MNGYPLAGLVPPEAMAALRNPATLAAMLDHLAECTGDTRMKRAAAQLRAPAGFRAGRPQSDDKVAIETMHAMLLSGFAKTPTRAARHIAAAGGRSPADIETIVHRLTAKYRGIYRKKLIISDNNDTESDASAVASA